MNTFARNLLLLVAAVCAIAGVVTGLTGDATLARYANSLLYAGIAVLFLGASTLAGNPDGTLGNRNHYVTDTNASRGEQDGRRSSQWANYSAVATGILAGALLIGLALALKSLP